MNPQKGSPALSLIKKVGSFKGRQIIGLPLEPTIGAHISWAGSGNVFEFVAKHISTAITCCLMYGMEPAHIPAMERF
jgi:hypothetical protein